MLFESNLTNKHKILASTIIVSVIWTILATLSHVNAMAAEKEEYGCTVVNEECVDFSNLKDAYLVSESIISFISLHALLGSALGLTGGLLITIFPHRKTHSGFVRS